jgi:hypothetical protein
MYCATIIMPYVMSEVTADHNSNAVGMVAVFFYTFSFFLKSFSRGPIRPCKQDDDRPDGIWKQ